MQLTKGWIGAREPSEAITGYLAMPEARGDLPGIVLIQEVWGVDGHIVDVADRLAASGYAVVAPDLYALDGQRPLALSTDRVRLVKDLLGTRRPSQIAVDKTIRDEFLGQVSAALREQVIETMDALFPPRDWARYAATVRLAIRFLRGHPNSNGSIGLLGFCMGGNVAAELACEQRDLAGSAIFYGQASAKCRELRCPALGLYGGLDDAVNNTIPFLIEAAQQTGQSFHWRVFDGVPHAFFNDTRHSFRASAARSAWAHLIGFLAKHVAKDGGILNRAGQL